MTKPWEENWRLDDANPVVRLHDNEPIAEFEGLRVARVDEEGRCAVTPEDEERLAEIREAWTSESEHPAYAWLPSGYRDTRPDIACLLRLVAESEKSLVDTRSKHADTLQYWAGRIQSNEDVMVISEARIAELKATLAESERARTEAERFRHAAEEAMHNMTASVSDRAARAEARAREAEAALAEAVDAAMGLRITAKVAQDQESGLRKALAEARLERQNADEQRALAVRMLEEERAKLLAANLLCNEHVHVDVFAAMSQRTETAEARVAELQSLVDAAGSFYLGEPVDGIYPVVVESDNDDGRGPIRWCLTTNEGQEIWFDERDKALAAARAYIEEPTL